MIRRPGFSALLALSFALAAGAASTSMQACGSEARGIDTCRTIENARCEQGAVGASGAPKCPDLLTAGDVDSCKRFYDVQCGRGVPDPVKDPSKTELERCLTAIRTSCDVAREPELSPACYFLLANQPPAVSDAADADAIDGEVADAPVDVPADAPADTAEAAPEVAADTLVDTLVETAAETGADASDSSDSSGG